MSRLLAVLVALPFLAGGVTAALTADRGEVVATFTDPEIVESSGLVVRGGLLSTINDSGDTGRVFTVALDGAEAGGTVGVTRFAESPVDMEALAPAGPGEVWVGDIGDNGAARSSISVTRVPVGRGERSGTYPTYDLVYADGPRDAETLLAHPRTGRLYVVSKQVFGGVLYAAPRRLDPDRPNQLRPVADAIPIATDGAFWPDGKHLVVRGYARAIVYAWPSMRAVGDLSLPDQDQGEGIAVTPDGRVLVSTEGQFTDVLEVRLPRDVRQAVAPTPEPAEPSATPEGEVDATDEPAAEDATTAGGLASLGGVMAVFVGLIALLGVVGWVVRRR
ncbi:MAG: WD40 repeat domain-containing protein [Actinomycetota bacterium]|nr:WD40 repeat domain-containing protein [Actinomycetota bacterium]